jgi:hypothetical protein
MLAVGFLDVSVQQHTVLVKDFFTHISLRQSHKVWVESNDDSHQGSEDLKQNKKILQNEIKT